MAVFDTSFPLAAPPSLGRGLFSALLPLVAVATCACSSPSEPKSPTAMNCPSGQHQEGEFCVVDAAAEPAAPEETKKEEEPEAPMETSEEPAPVSCPEGSVPDTEDPTGCRPQPLVDEEPGIDEGESNQELSFAAPVDISMAAQAGPIVTHLAASYLPAGASPMGIPFAAQFAEGQVQRQEVQLERGKCYTVVSVGLPAVSELNVYIFPGNMSLSSPLNPEESLAADGQTGNQAVLGPRDKCFQPSESAIYQLVVQVAAGQGVAAAQVFRR